MSLSDKIKNAKIGESLFNDIPPDKMYALKTRVAIANVIYHERKRRGMSPTEFAEFCDVAQPMVSRWESGEYNFSIDGLSALFYRLNLRFPFLASSVEFTVSAPPAKFTASSSETVGKCNLNLYDFKSYRNKYFALKEN